MVLTIILSGTVRMRDDYLVLWKIKELSFAGTVVKTF